MSSVFHSATEQQLSLWDSYESLTPGEKKALDQSWANIFAEKKSGFPVGIVMY